MDSACESAAPSLEVTTKVPKTLTRGKNVVYKYDSCINIYYFFKRFQRERVRVPPLLNGCPAEAGKIETFANTGGFTLAALAAEQGVTLDETAAANAAAVSSSAAPRAAAASLLLAAIVATSAFLVM